MADRPITDGLGTTTSYSGSTGQIDIYKNISDKATPVSADTLIGFDSEDLDTPVGIDVSFLLDMDNMVEGTTNKIFSDSERTSLENIVQLPVDIGTHGFTDNTETTLSFNDTTYVVTLADSGAGWSYWRDGIKYTITGNKTVTISGTPPAADTYYIYIDATDGTLTVGTTVWTILDSKVPVAILCWNDTLTPKYCLSDERHTSAFDKTQHAYEHLTYGTRLQSPGAITGYTVKPSSPTDADNTYAVGETTIWDEDLQHALTALADGGPYHIEYRTGASTWSWLQQAIPFRYTAAGYIQWDNAGTMTEGSDGNFYNTFILATNNTGTQASRFAVIHGQGEYDKLAEAQAATFSDLDLSGLQFAEAVAVYQLIWRTKSSYTTAGKCRMEVAPITVNINISQQASAPGLGTMSTQNSDSVSITGGSIAGLTSFSVGTSPTIDVILESGDGASTSDTALLTAGWASIELDLKANIASPTFTGSATFSTVVVGGISINDILISSDGASTSDTTLVTAGWIDANISGGDIVGPASSTNNAIALWDGTTGKLLKNSFVGVTQPVGGSLLNVNNISGYAQLEATGDGASNTIPARFQLSNSDDSTWFGMYYNSNGTVSVKLTSNEILTFDALGKGTFKEDLTINGDGTFTGDVKTNNLPAPNLLINSDFSENQRGVSGTVVLAAGEYGHDRFKGGASGCTYTFATSNGVTTITISAGSLIQTVETTKPGAHTLSWTGTAQAELDGGGAAVSPITETLIGGANVVCEWDTGTVTGVVLNKGSVATPFVADLPSVNLAKCQRYYERIAPGTTSYQFGLGYAETTTQGNINVNMEPKRDLTYTIGFNNIQMRNGNTLYTTTSPTLSARGKSAFNFTAQSTGMTQNGILSVQGTATDCYIEIINEI